ncbi:hypothetical protein TWF281_006303 [Arthrobotrys megalospora]
MLDTSVRAETPAEEIKLGQTYTVNRTGEAEAHQGNGRSEAPENGFILENKGTPASAVVYKTVEGRKSPIYVSPDGPIKPGVVTLTPRSTCKIWVAGETENTIFVTRYESNPCEIDLTGLRSVEIDYANGKWIRMTENKRSDGLVN